MNRLTRRHPTFKGMIILYPQRRKIKDSPRTHIYRRSKGKTRLLFRKSSSKKYR